MISDVLSQAVHELDHYLNNRGVYQWMYAGEFRERIIACRNEMDAIRAELDKSPSLSLEKQPIAGHHGKPQ